MLDLFKFGEYFLNSLKPVGDWLMQPISEVIPDWIDWSVDLFTWFIPSVKVGSTSSILFASSDVTVAMWIFGAGLTSILSFKLIKFVTDMFT